MTLHKRNNQKGFGTASLLGVLIATMFIGYFLVQMGIAAKRQHIIENSKNFYQQVDAIKDALQQYQVDQINQGNVDPIIFAHHWSDLTPNYLPACSDTESRAGKCRKAEDTIWGTKMTLTELSVPTATGLRGVNQLTIPLLPSTGDFAFEHNIQLSTLMKLPFAKYDSTKNVITWQVRKVGTELSNEQLVHRDGKNSTLTGDWDVGGNFSIINAKNVAVKNVDGTSRNLAASDFLVAKDHQVIAKPSCPSGLHPKIITGVKSIENMSFVNNIISSVGSQRAYATDNNSSWTVHLDYSAEIANHHVTQHTGEINVQLICQL